MPDPSPHYGGATERFWGYHSSLPGHSWRLVMRCAIEVSRPAHEHARARANHTNQRTKSQ